MSTVFFAFNHPNYSRWIIKFHDNLLKMEADYPNYKHNFVNGCFSVKRTNKPFSRSPVDLTLEQTINADAARTSGVSSITNSVDARQRWAQSHSLRTSVVSRTFEDAGCSTKEDVSQELHEHRKQKDKKSINSLITTIKNFMNPFGDIPKGKLFNIASGKAASTKTEEFLLNVLEIGKASRNKFIEECALDPARFEKLIKKGAVSTFANEGVKYSVKQKEIIHELKLERDLISKMLLLSIDNKIDLELVLSYPLTPVPLSLCNLDGNMIKTNKSALLKILESFDTNPQEPESIDAVLVDGFFFLHLLKDPPQTFEGLARFILSKICALKGKEIHLVFDKIVTPSLKDVERDRRISTDLREENYIITGPRQRRPANFLGALRQDSFKKSLVTYLNSEWENNNYQAIIGDKVLYVTDENQCNKYFTENEKVIKEIVEDYYCEHEEADSRIVFHLKKSKCNNIILRTSDTDIAIITLGNIEKINKEKRVWMETGHVSNNSLRYINLSNLYSTLGPDLCRALPAFHAFTGCDYTAAFYGKGKKRPLKLLTSCRDTQLAFGSLGSNKTISEKTSAVIEKYVCKLYGRPKVNNTNKARLDCFVDTYKCKSTKNPLVLKKTLNAQVFPPCRAVLMEKIARTNQVAAIWTNATEVRPAFYEPINHGWIYNNNKYEPCWFKGPQTPNELQDILHSSSDNDDAESDDDLSFVESISDEDYD